MATCTRPCLRAHTHTLYARSLRARAQNPASCSVSILTLTLAIFLESSATVRKTICFSKVIVILMDCSNHFYSTLQHCFDTCPSTSGIAS